MTDRKFQMLWVMVLLLTTITSVSAYNQTSLYLVENTTLDRFGENQVYDMYTPSYTASLMLSGGQTGTLVYPAVNYTVFVQPLQTQTNILGFDLALQMLIVIAFSCAVMMLLQCIMFISWLRGQLNITKSEV